VYDTMEVTKPITIAAGMLTNPAAGSDREQAATMPEAAPKHSRLAESKVFDQHPRSMPAAAAVFRKAMNAEPASGPQRARIQR